MAGHDQTTGQEDWFPVVIVVCQQDEGISSNKEDSTTVLPQNSWNPQVNPDVLKSISWSTEAEVIVVVIERQVRCTLLARMECYIPYHF